jgi:tetratricopeptide (TPR) repeat protein
MALRLGGSIFLTLQEQRNMVSLRAKGSYRILCLGESTTALGGKDSYPSQLETILNGANTGITFSVINKGIPGVDTSYILAQLENNIREYKPDLVVTMMGINDFGQCPPYKNQGFLACLPFVSSLRIFKLGSLLRLRILDKAKELPSEIPQSKIMDKATESSGYTERALQKNIELNPNNDEAYIELGLFYLNQGRLVLGLFKKAVELKTTNEHAYIALGLWESCDKQDSSHDVSEAEKILKEAIALNPQNDKAYFGLGLLYANHAHIPQAIAAFKKAIEINPKSDKAYGALAALYDEKGDPVSSERNYRKANELRKDYCNPQTAQNYRNLKVILDKKGIRLVCVQYPLRSIRPLEDIFYGQDGIIYVDNERIFRKAIKERGYGSYFLDIFGGDFGHCNKEGNMILATNIANAILKNGFRK